MLVWTNRLRHVHACTLWGQSPGSFVNSVKRHRQYVEFYHVFESLCAQAHASALCTHTFQWRARAHTGCRLTAPAHARMHARTHALWHARTRQTALSLPVNHWQRLYYYYCYYWSLLYSAILRSRADSLRSHVILHEWIAFYSTFFNIHRRWTHTHTKNVSRLGPIGFLKRPLRKSLKFTLDTFPLKSPGRWNGKQQEQWKPNYAGRAALVFPVIPLCVAYPQILSNR